MGALTLTSGCFDFYRRLREVQQGAPACDDHGPHRARCILPPDHSGIEHEGNGFDEWGPKYCLWLKVLPGGSRRPRIDVGASSAVRAAWPAPGASQGH